MYGLTMDQRTNVLKKLNVVMIKIKQMDLLNKFSVNVYLDVVMSNISKRLVL